MAPRNTGLDTNNLHSGFNENQHGLAGHHGPLEPYAMGVYYGVNLNTDNSYRFSPQGISPLNVLMTPDAFVSPRLFSVVGSGGMGAACTYWSTRGAPGGRGAAGAGGGGAVKNSSSNSGNGGAGGFMGGGGGAVNQNTIGGDSLAGGGGGGAGGTIGWTSTQSGQGGPGFVAVEW
jgi:hypothetical protein